MGRPRSSDIAESTPRGLFSARYTRSSRTLITSPSTRMTAVAGSTRVPIAATRRPSTETRPAAISSSQARREPSPAAASTFCSRTPSSVRISASSCHSSSSSRAARSGSSGASEGSSSSDCRPIRSRNSSEVRNRLGAALRLDADLDDQPAGEQGADDAVDVHAADRRHPRARHRLAVRDHGERLERGLAEPGALAVLQELLDLRREHRAGVEPEAARRLAQLEAGAALVVAGAAAAPAPRLTSGPGTCSADASAVSETGVSRTNRIASTAPSSGPGRNGCAVSRLDGLVRRFDLLLDLAHEYSSSTSAACDADVGFVRPHPAHLQLGEGGSLVEGDHLVTVELEQREEAADHLERRARSRRPGCGTSPRPIGAAARAGSIICSRTLTFGAWRWSTATVGTGRGVSATLARAASCVRVDPEEHVGQQLGEARFELDRPAVAASRVRRELAQVRRRQLVRAVLQQPGEQQVAGLEQGQVVLVLDVGGGQQPRRLEVEQGRRHDEELGRLLQVEARRRRCGR